MESVFGSAIPGLNSGGQQQTLQGFFVYHGGPRYMQCDQYSAIDRERKVLCDLGYWTNPGSEQQLIYVVVLCPECGKPMVITHQHSPLVGEGGAITIPRLLKCSGHWPEISADGYRTGRRASCSWQGVIRDGSAHSPRCPLAQIVKQPNGTLAWRVEGSPSNCRCGGALTRDEKDALIRAQQSRVRTV